MIEIVLTASWLMIGTGVSVFIVLISGITAQYGRYTTNESYFSVPARLAWFIQESPAFFIPLGFLLFQSKNDYGVVLNIMMLAHYFNRTFIFPRKLKSKNGSPWYIMLSAVVFCCWNGFIQGAWNAKYQQSFEQSSTTSLVLCLIGIFLFVIGFLINNSADSILLNLRKPGETGYKVPKGGLFDYVSCANYFGEIIEWAGYATAAQSLPAIAFAIFTFCNIGPRAIAHHNWYITKFKDYPKDRKALIPFFW